MVSAVDILGLHFFEVAFCVSFVALLFTTSYQLFIQSYFVFILLLISYRIIRNNGATKLPSGGKYVLITGCDTGFGNALARLLDRRGMNVIATCLSDKSQGAISLKKMASKRIQVLEMDVSSDDSVKSCLSKVISTCHNEGLWAIVNNAGIGYSGECEIQPMSMYKKIAEVNLFGTVRVCKAFLPQIRKVKGRVVNVTSVQGLHAGPRESAYVMSKFAMEGFSDCLRLEMKRFGVKVILIVPGKYGGVTSQFTEENVQRFKNVYNGIVDSLSDETREAYGEEYLRMMANDIPNIRPDASDKDLKDVLDALEDAVLSFHPKIRYLVDGDGGWVDNFCIMARLNRILPASIMDCITLWQRPFPKEAFYSTQAK